MQQIKTLVKKIKESDSIVIGAGSGMSNAAEQVYSGRL